MSILKNFFVTYSKFETMTEKDTNFFAEIHNTNEMGIFANVPFCPIQLLEKREGGQYFTIPANSANFKDIYLPMRLQHTCLVCVCV